MTTNTTINDAAMENAAGGITASEYWDGVKYLLFGDEYENYIQEQKEKDELFGEESHWSYRKQLGL